MTQEIQVTITLEVDVTRTKEDVQAFIESKLKNLKHADLIRVDSIKEEAEIYKVEDSEQLPVQVYFERKNHCDLVATFKNEKTYLVCLEALEKEAKETGYNKVTERIND